MTAKVKRETFANELDVCGKCERIYRPLTKEALSALAIKPVVRVMYEDGEGRSWLTLSAAYCKYANAKIRRKHPCECEPSDYLGDPGFTCGQHSGGAFAARIARLSKRFQRWLKWHDREVRKRGASPFAKPS